MHPRQQPFQHQTHYRLRCAVRSLLRVAVELYEQAFLDSVLALLSSYPGDATLKRYLEVAIQDGFLPVHVYTACFLLGVRSAELQDADTLNMLCRVVLDATSASGKPLIDSVLPMGATPTDTLNSIQLALQLIKTVGVLPISVVHPLYDSMAALLLLLLTYISDYSTITPSQAFAVLNEASPALSCLRISPVRPMLEEFVFQLLQITDDRRVAMDAQMIHSQQFTSSDDIIGPSSESDIVSFGLLFHTWVRKNSNLVSASSELVEAF